MVQGVGVMSLQNFMQRLGLVIQAVPVESLSCLFARARLFNHLFQQGRTQRQVFLSLGLHKSALTNLSHLREQEKEVKR